MSISLVLLLRGIPIIFGGGTTVSHVADADMSGDQELQAELGFEDPAIGYEYEYFSIFFLDVWTGEGQPVLYDQSSDRYLPLDDELMQALTGRTADSVSAPFLYHVPLGWIVFGSLLLGAIGGWWLRYRELAS